ncbi:MAG: photosynthetic complex putative assembly protein PuhB [Granulosicoccus sp.]
MQDHDDFDFEHSPGIPAPLPPGEQIVWQGKPDTRDLAINAFHMRKVMIYFALILAFHYLSVLHAESNGQQTSINFTTTVLLSLLGIGILAVLAWLTARVTIYTVTNRRILIRFGVALQITINLPFSQIKGADMRVGKNGFGDIPLALKDASRVNYIVMWPHVRPWRFSKPQPMLRSIPEVQRVAEIVRAVAAESADVMSPRTAKSPSPTLPLSDGGFTRTEAL